MSVLNRKKLAIGVMGLAPLFVGRQPPAPATPTAPLTPADIITGLRGLPVDEFFKASYRQLLPATQ